MTYVPYDGFDISPSLTIDTPASAWRRTTSITAASTRDSSAAASSGMPSPLAHIMRIKSSGRGRLPVWVHRMRSMAIVDLGPFRGCSELS